MPSQTTAKHNGQHSAPYVPPQNIEAEQSTLGAMLIESAAIDKAAALLAPLDFYLEDNRMVFAAILALHREGCPVDTITLPAELKARGQFAKIGGIEFVTALFDTVPTTANVEYHAGIVADKARLRAQITDNEAIAAAARVEGADPADIARRMEEAAGRALQGAAKTSTARRKPLAERMIDLADVQPPGDLPLLYGQYLLKGASHWLTGQTGIGKSTIVYNLVCALAEGSTLWGEQCEQTCVLYVDMESGDVGRSLKVERLYLGAERVRGQLLFLREPMRLPDELADLLAFVQGAGINLVVFDTARRCFSVKDENNNAEVYNRVVPVLDALKQIGVATLTLGHPAKNGNGSAHGAGAQEDAGDVNLSLSMHRGEVSDTDGVLALRVTKNRLLGLGVPPLYLKRIGNDQFERVDVGDPLVSESLTAEVLARTLVREVLRTQENGQAQRKEIEGVAVAQGVSTGTLDRALPKMVREGLIVLIKRGVYGLPDPFADDNAPT